MNESDMQKYCLTYGIVYEESHYHMAITEFCNAVKDAYAEGPDGEKFELLLQQVKENLTPEIFNDLFKERF